MNTLSVIMASYNYGHYLPVALEALLKQTLKPLEIIIIDDASTDHSVEIVKKYQKKSPLIHLYQNKKNLGVIATANRGIELAKGDYLAFSAADDEVLPPFFKESMELLQNHPQAAICSSIFCTFYDEDPAILHSYSALLSKQKTYLTPSQFVSQVRKKDIRLGGQNTIFKKKAVLDAGKLLPQLGHMCDWFLISYLALKYGVCFIPEVLTKMRIHKNSYSQVLAKKRNGSKNLLETIEQLMGDGLYKDTANLFLDSGLIYQIGIHIVPSLFKKKHRKYINKTVIIKMMVTFLKGIKFQIWNFLRKFRSGTSS